MLLLYSKWLEWNIIFIRQLINKCYTNWTIIWPYTEKTTDDVSYISLLVSTFVSCACTSITLTELYSRRLWKDQLCFFYRHLMPFPIQCAFKLHASTYNCCLKEKDWAQSLILKFFSICFKKKKILSTWIEIFLDEQILFIYAAKKIQLSNGWCS